LVLGTPGSASSDWVQRYRQDADVVAVDSLRSVVDMLRHDRRFDAILADPADSTLVETLGTLFQANQILAAIPDGVAVVDFDLKIRWANATFQSWCGSGSPVGRGFYEALGSPRISGPDFCPFHTALTAAIDPNSPPPPATIRLQCRDNRHYDLHVTPVYQTDNRERLLIVVGRDVTALVLQQQKLDALHKAGGELAALSADQLAEMSVQERIELLKLNIRRFTRDLLHYEIIEIRLLDAKTGQLQPLLQEGMTAEAAHRALHVGTEGQGVTGHVAATGETYLCVDTRTDPLYLQGSAGARSSLTVPLIYQQHVIGTFNVESPRANAFGEEDQQFAELFSYEIANALHTLELLSAEKRGTASKSIDLINREVVLPVDEILAATSAVLDRYIGHDAEMADKLRKILQSARSIKACIQKVGEDLAPAPPGEATKQAPAPSLRGLHVLVADNDERVRRSAHGLLGRWGCVVETARDGQEALTMAKLGAYDAVLADIRLPDMTGYEAYKGLRQAQPTARVILMTSYGYDPTHSLVKARQDGLRHVLFKPFRVDQLWDALTKLDSAQGTPTVAQRIEGNGTRILD
jgi:CheY-like chemotaxis protein/PAS domain-containing protein